MSNPGGFLKGGGEIRRNSHDCSLGNWEAGEATNQDPERGGGEARGQRSDFCLGKSVEPLGLQGDDAVGNGALEKGKKPVHIHLTVEDKVKCKK